LLIIYGKIITDSFHTIGVCDNRRKVGKLVKWVTQIFREGNAAMCLRP